MKIVLQLITFISMAAPSFALGQTILLMDTIEFNTVQHDQGKWRYVNQLTDVLKKMRLKSGSFDAMNSDKNEVYELIQRNSVWDKISADVETACKKPDQKKNCANLAKIRTDTFDFIKDNPEGLVEPGTDSTTHH